MPINIRINVYIAVTHYLYITLAYRIGAKGANLVCYANINTPVDTVQHYIQGSLPRPHCNDLQTLLRGRGNLQGL